MTDRVHSLTVVLDKDYRDDDVQAIVDAMRMIKGVLCVKNVIVDGDSWMAEERAKKELRDKLWEVLK